MKDFSPHAILHSPLTPDASVEALINLICSGKEGPVTLLIEPSLPTPKDERLLPGSWSGFEIPEPQTPRYAPRRPSKFNSADSITRQLGSRGVLSQ